MTSHLRSGLALLALAFPATAAADAPANPFAKGPDPTAATLQTTAGPYAITQTAVRNGFTPGFGAAMIYAPRGATGETFGGVAISPGFLADGSTMYWLGARIARQGFVVIVMSPNNIFDQPASRGAQLLRSLDYLTTTSTAKDLVDPLRLAVVGHSMGGGGVLEAAKRRVTLKATVGIAPWNLDKSWPEIKSPSLIIGAKGDTIASEVEHAIPFYKSLPQALPKAYEELKMDHVTPLFRTNEIATASISWLKRFVDDDARYTPMLCPDPVGARPGSVTQYQNTCGTF